MGHFVENLPESFVSEEMVETAAVCNVFLSGQKNPARGVNRGSVAEMKKIDTNCLEVGSAWQSRQDTVPRELES